MKRYIKNILRPCVNGAIRTIYARARGLAVGTLSQEAIAALINKPNPTILEIGCNDGRDTLAFLRAMPQAQMYCFEPDPRAIARFKRQLGSSFKSVRLFELAICNQTGPIDFHMSDGGDLPGGWDQSGSIRRAKNHLEEHPWVKFERTITVDACRLDDWCIQHGVIEIDFIWMDVQGAEGDVIAGASRTLRKTRFLYTEYSNDELYENQISLKELRSRLPRFEVITRYPNDVLLRNTAI